MTYTKVFIFGLILCTLGIAGCTNTPTSSGFGTGGGYSINLTANQSSVQQGGQITLIATVRDAQGNPVNDSTTGVSFTSSLGATITAVTSITLGACSTTYTAPSSTNTGTPGFDRVTASYQGAFASVSIYVYAP